MLFRFLRIDYLLLCCLILYEVIKVFIKEYLMTFITFKCCSDVSLTVVDFMNDICLIMLGFLTSFTLFTFC